MGREASDPSVRERPSWVGARRSVGRSAPAGPLAPFECVAGVLVGLVGLKPVLWDRRPGKLTIILVVGVALGAIGVAVWNEVAALELHSIRPLIAFGIGGVADGPLRDLYPP